MPLPKASVDLLCLFETTEDAIAAVPKIMTEGGIVPTAIEFMDRTAIHMVKDYSDLGLPETAGALLMIEVDGPADCLSATADAVASAARNQGLLELSVARDREQIATLWRTRKALSPALRHVAPKKINEDVVVPVSRRLPTRSSTTRPTRWRTRLMSRPRLPGSMT